MSPRYVPKTKYIQTQVSVQTWLLLKEEAVTTGYTLQELVKEILTHYAEEGDLQWQKKLEPSGPVV